MAPLTSCSPPLSLSLGIPIPWDTIILKLGLIRQWPLSVGSERKVTHLSLSIKRQKRLSLVRMCQEKTTCLVTERSLRGTWKIFSRSKFQFYQCAELNRAKANSKHYYKILMSNWCISSLNFEQENIPLKKLERPHFVSKTIFFISKVTQGKSLLLLLLSHFSHVQLCATP